MNAYDLVVVDLDGTLLNSRHELSDTVLAAVREAEQRGIRVTLASGRGNLALKL